MPPSLSAAVKARLVRRARSMMVALRSVAFSRPSGVLRALKDLVAELGEGGAGALDAVMIGTTHFTNAVVERRALSPIAALRIGLPASASLPPFVDWPEDLTEIVRGEVFQVEGGHEYDGRPIAAFDEKAVRSAARRIRDIGLRSVAVASSSRR